MVPEKVRRLFSPPSWPGWVQLLYKAIDAWGNADFLRGKMDALKAYIISPVAVVLALAWLFIIALGWHTKLWSLVVRRKAPDSDQPREPLQNKATLQGSETKEIVTGPTAQFYSRRHEYGWFRGHVESATEVWAFWHVGTSAKNNGLFRTGRIKRLLLAFPNSEEVTALAEITHIDPGVLRSDIFEAAKEAQKWGVEVKWWQGHIVDPFTIGDPTKSGSVWVITEHVVPYVDADQRPSNYITDVQVCDRYREAFMEMWGNKRLTQATLGLRN